MLLNKQKSNFFLLILLAGLFIFNSVFAADTGILTVTTTGSGTVNSVDLYSPTLAGSNLGSVGSINGIACGADCTEEYSLYSAVTLVATPTAPSLVSKWTGCSVSATNPNSCTVNIFGNITVSVQFVAPHTFYTLTVAKSAGGSVAGQGINCGTDCYFTVDISGNQRWTYTATPDAGYGVSWSGDTALCGANSACTLVIDPGTGTDQGAPLVDVAEANFTPLVCSAVKNVTASFGAPNLPTCSVTATPPSIASGQSATLNWSSANASSASFDQGIGNVPTNGNGSTKPVNTTTYTLTVKDASGNSNLCSVTVTVGAAPAPSGSFLPKKIREILPF